MPRKKSNIGYRKKYHRTRHSKLGRAYASDKFFSNVFIFENLNGDVFTGSLKNSIKRTYASDQFFFNVFSSENLNSDCEVIDESVESPNEVYDSDGLSAQEFYVVLDKVHKYDPQQNLDELVSTYKSHIFTKLKSECFEIKNEQFFLVPSSQDIKFISVYDTDDVSESPRIKAWVRIEGNFKLGIFVHSQKLPSQHSLWERIGDSCYTVKQVNNVLNEIGRYFVCFGNRDEELQKFVTCSTSGQKLAFKEERFIGPTIRSISCCLLIKKHAKSERCSQCNKYRKTLLKLKSRRDKDKSLPTSPKDWVQSTVPNLWLTENEKTSKLKQLKTSSLYLENEVKKLKAVTENEVKKLKAVTE